MSDLDFGPPASFHELIGKEEKSPRRRAIRWVMGIVSAVGCLSGVIALLVFGLGINPFFGEGLGEPIVFGSSQTLWYSSKVTPEEAQQLAQYCKSAMASPHGYDLHLTRTDGVLIVSFFVNPSDWEDQKVIEDYGQLRKTIAD
jgi:hypothetical protein